MQRARWLGPFLSTKKTENYQSKPNSDFQTLLLHKPAFDIPELESRPFLVDQTAFSQQSTYITNKEFNRYV